MKEIKKVIYLSHDYGGKEVNKVHIEQVIKRLVRLYPDYVFVSPVHCFGYMYHDMSYDEGMRHCLALLDLCDENWFVKGHASGKGCGIEREYSLTHRIPIAWAPDCDDCTWNNKDTCGVDFCIRAGCSKASKR